MDAIGRPLVVAAAILIVVAFAVELVCGCGSLAPWAFRPTPPARASEFPAWRRSMRSSP